MPDPEEYISEKTRELITRLKESSLYRITMDVLFKVNFYLAPFNPLFWKGMIESPSFREFWLRRESKIGLLEGSIIQNPLWIPESDGNDLVQHIETGGQWYGYDFQREAEFGKEARPVKRGKLVSIIPEELKPLSPRAYTPTGSVHPLNYVHFLQLEMPSIDYLVQHGVVEETTYERAFERVGMLERYVWNLSQHQLLDLPVFQVTPKGNGLVSLGQPGGKKITKELKEADKQLAALPEPVKI